MTFRSSVLTRRNLLLGATVGLGALAARQCLVPRNEGDPLFPVADGENGAGALPERRQRAVADAGRLARDAQEEPPEVIVDRLRAALAEARAAGRPFVASAARHSMGGQSLARDGTVVTLDQEWLEPDKAGKTYRVAAGARWSGVLAKLDQLGFSPAVMQAYNDFGVASTYLGQRAWLAGALQRLRQHRAKPANAAGRRQPGHLLADRKRRAFRARHGRLRSLRGDHRARARDGAERAARADLRGPRRPRSRQKLRAAARRGSPIQMAYGRMDVALDRFLERWLLITYRPAADQRHLPPLASGTGLVSRSSRYVFRAQVGSDPAKHFRWWTEAGLGPWITGNATRNNLLNERVLMLADRDPARTDILHEYFVAPARFADFVTACREVIPASYQQLLNITLRYVGADHDSVLAYAPEPRIAAVLLFTQEKTERGEADMARMTRELIDRVLALGGTYYLPYRPHATLDAAEARLPARRRIRSEKAQARSRPALPQSPLGRLPVASLRLPGDELPGGASRVAIVWRRLSPWEEHPPSRTQGGIMVDQLCTAAGIEYRAYRREFPEAVKVIFLTATCWYSSYGSSTRST